MNQQRSKSAYKDGKLFKPRFQRAPRLQNITPKAFNLSKKRELWASRTWTVFEEMLRSKSILEIIERLDTFLGELVENVWRNFLETIPNEQLLENY